jgi:hypothetical protein
MITNVLPKRIRYVPAAAIFSAPLGVPNAGIFDFNSQRQTFIPTLSPNTVYLIDSFSVSGNVPEADFLSSFLTVPVLTLLNSANNTTLFDSPIQINAFSTDRQICHFFKTGQNNSGIAATLSGQLSLISNFIGIGTVSLSLNLSVHAIDSTEFELDFKAKG